MNFSFMYKDICVSFAEVNHWVFWTYWF